MQQPTETPNTEVIIAKICELVKNRDKKQLDQLLTGYCIGIRDNQWRSAIHFLAREGDEDSVNFLLSHYDDNINSAVTGAGEGGKVDLVNNLLARGALTTFALAGACLGRKIELIKYLQRGESIGGEIPAIYLADFTDPETIEIINLLKMLFNKEETILSCFSSLAKNNQKNALFNLISMSEQQGGHVLFNALLKRCIGFAIFGAAAGGHEVLLEELLDYANKAGVMDTTSFAVSGAGVNGSPTLINRFKTQDNTHDLAYGLAVGGHRESLLNLINENIHEARAKILRHAIQGACAAGHAALIKELISLGAKIMPALEMTVRSGHLSIINTYSFKLDEDIRTKIIDQFIEIGIITDNIQEMLRLASFIDNWELRFLIIKKTIDLKVGLGDDQKRMQLDSFQDMAEKIRELISDNKFTYNQALAWMNFELRPFLLAEKTAQTHAFFALPKELQLVIYNHVISAPLTAQEYEDVATKWKAYVSEKRSLKQTAAKEDSSQDQEPKTNLGKPSKP